LTSGDYFGEIGNLIHFFIKLIKKKIIGVEEGVRTATIVCRENTHLLYLSKSAYHKILEFKLNFEKN